MSVGVGLATRGRVPFLDTFACFLTRADLPGIPGDKDRDTQIFWTVLNGPERSERSEDAGSGRE